MGEQAISKGARLKTGCDQAPLRESTVGPVPRNYTDHPVSQWGLTRGCQAGGEDTRRVLSPRPVRVKCAGGEEMDFKQFTILIGKKNKVRNFLGLLKENRKV